jgi:hypothetical protein
MNKLFAGYLFLILATPASADRLPATFVGVWGLQGHGTSSNCTASSFPDRAQDTLAKVSPDKIEFLEAGCLFSVVTFSKKDSLTVTIALNCEVEGNANWSTEIWRVAQIRGGETYLKMASQRPSITIYRRCR